MENRMSYESFKAYNNPSNPTIMNKYKYFCPTCGKVTEHRDRQQDDVLKMKCLECGVVR